MPGPGAEKPHRRRRSCSVRERAGATLKSPAARRRPPAGPTTSERRRPGAARRRRAARRPRSSCVEVARRGPCRRPAARRGRPGTIRRSFAQASRATRSSPSARACALAEPTRVERRASAPRARAARGETRIAFAWPEKAERSSPWFRSVSARPSAAVIGSGPSRGGAATRPRRHPAPGAEVPSAQSRHLLEAEHVGPVGGREAHHLLEERAPLAAGRCCRGRGSSCGRAAARA